MADIKIEITEEQKKEIPAKVAEKVKEFNERNAQLVERWQKLEGEVSEWFAVTFPEATQIGQLLKLEEELKELTEEQAKEDGRELQEMADVCIVCFGLGKYNSLIRFGIVNYLVDDMDFEEREELIFAIEEKMKANRARKWRHIGNGVYKHKKCNCEVDCVCSCEKGA